MIVSSNSINVLEVSFSLKVLYIGSVFRRSKVLYINPSIAQLTLLVTEVAWLWNFKLESTIIILKSLCSDTNEWHGTCITNDLITLKLSSHLNDHSFSDRISCSD